MHRTSFARFVLAMDKATLTNPRITENCSPAPELPPEARYYLDTWGTAGFGITPTGELIAVFKARPGQGPSLVEVAKALGATWLDCFDDGFLVDYYRRHGFQEYRREANWDPKGGPDVVYMATTP